MLAVLPLVPWTARNWRTFHVIQPLAPRRVNDPGEVVYYGFYSWMNTWSVDYVSTGNVFWRVGSEPIDRRTCPRAPLIRPRSTPRPRNCSPTVTDSNTLTPALDARFAAIAAERIRAHPFLCRVWVLPALRETDMVLCVRASETLDLDDWWRFRSRGRSGMETSVLGCSTSAGDCGPGGCAGACPGPGCWAYLVLRCVLLSTMENSEPRYTLEMMACAACATRMHDQRLRQSMRPQKESGVAPGTSCRACRGTEKSVSWASTRCRSHG